MSKAKNEELIIYRTGVVHCSICTNVEDRKRIVELVNQKSPTGINGRWEISEDETFASGEPNPCPCEKHPESHKHYLMVC